jgi:hypothetical protein
LYSDTTHDQRSRGPKQKCAEGTGANGRIQHDTFSSTGFRAVGRYCHGGYRLLWFTYAWTGGERLLMGADAAIR